MGPEGGRYVMRSPGKLCYVSSTRSMLIEGFSVNDAVGMIVYVGGSDRCRGLVVTFDRIVMTNRLYLTELHVLDKDRHEWIALNEV